MGENAFLYRQEVSYPGLVKPYRKENGSIDPSVIYSGSRSTTKAGVSDNEYTRMNELEMKQKQKYDPFSRYDDDLGEEHYFLVPKVQGNNLQICEWRRTVKTSRSLRNIAKLASEHKPVGSVVKDRTLTFPPMKVGQNINKDAGEYCFISSSDKISNNLKENISVSQLRSSVYKQKDRENLRDFASKFATNQDEGPKPLSRSHSFEEERKFDTWVELEGIAESTSNTRAVRTKLDDTIDYCTCMVCVKALYYHCTKDDEEDSIDNPCSCVGTRGSVIKRWTCLTLLACLMPCLFCYLPARGCVNLCRKCGKDKEDTSASNRTLKVRYKKPDRRKAKESTNLL